MKSSVKYIIVLAALLSSYSCMKESFNNCPNWGKYKVCFYDRSNLKCSSVNYITLLYSGVDSSWAPMLRRYTHTADSLLIDSTGLLRLFPGTYSFRALLCAEGDVLNDRVHLRNGHRYLYAATVDRVQKSPENRVGFHFKLANSMIIVKCTLESSLEGYEISKVEVTPPEEKSALLNISNGICSYEQCTSSFFDNALYNQSENEWVYYCNPTIAGNYLSFKITLSNSISTIFKTLFTKVFLEIGLEQGRVNRFYLNVTPNKVEYLSSTIIDWTDYNHSQEIVL